MTTTLRGFPELRDVDAQVQDPDRSHDTWATADTVTHLMAAGRLGEAQAAAAGLVRDVKGGRARAELRLLLSSLRFMDGRPSESVAEAAAAVDEPGIACAHHAAAELARLLGLLAQSNFADARRRAESILAGGTPAGDASLAGALTVLGFIGWHEGHIADGLGLMQAGVQRFDNGPRELNRVYPRMILATLLSALGQFDEAGAAIALAADEIDDIGDSMWAPGPAVARARLHLAAGRPDEAINVAKVVVGTAELGARVFAPGAQLTWATAAFVQGRLGEAAEQVRAFRAGPEAGRVLFGSALYTWVEARVVEAQRGTSAAVDVLAGVYDDPAAHRRLFVEEPAAPAWMVRAALAVDEPALARTVAASVEQLAAENRAFPSVVAGAEHACGLVRRDPDQVLEAASVQSLPWARASALEDAGVLVDEQGGPQAGQQSGRHYLEQGREAYLQIGATRDAARVAVRLRRTGLRRRAERPIHGWPSLTDTERRVASVVAEGLSNPEVGARMFLSRHTVDFHLRQIFRKLDIHSRVELTRHVMECGSA